MLRADLLNEVIAARARFETMLAHLDPACMVVPDLPGEWSIKDLLAHLGWWEQRSVEIYHELVSGGHPSRPMTPVELDAVNAAITAQFRSWGLEEVRSYEREAYQSIIHLVEAAPEADLFDGRHFDWMNGEPFKQWILDNSTGHYEEHWPSLERNLQTAAGLEK